MPNLFTISPYMCLEDRFTLYWEYLLHHTPGLGQEIVDYIADTTGIPRSKFVECRDHPFFNREDLPDLMIVCEDYDLICEHKIDSPLGIRQLQRYCDLETEKTSYVLLISNSTHQGIDQEVLDHNKYLKPIEGNFDYFLWEYFYPLISRHNHHLAQEFCEYMELEGMTTLEVQDVGDIFTDEKAGAQFKEIWTPISQYFKGLNPPAKACVRDKVGIGMHVQMPMPKIRLIYFWVRKKPIEFSSGFKGRTISMRVFGNTHDDGLISSLPETQEKIQTPDDVPDYHVRTSGDEKADSNGYVLLREYAVPMDFVLESDLTLAKERLLDFVRISMDHLNDTVASL